MSDLLGASQARPGHAQLVTTTAEVLVGCSYASAQAIKEVIEYLHPDQYDTSGEERADASAYPATVDGS